MRNWGWINMDWLTPGWGVFNFVPQPYTTINSPHRMLPGSRPSARDALPGIPVCRRSPGKRSRVRSHESRVCPRKWAGCHAIYGCFSEKMRINESIMRRPKQHWNTQFLDKIAVGIWTWGTIMAGNRRCFAVGCFAKHISRQSQSPVPHFWCKIVPAGANGTWQRVAPHILPYGGWYGDNHRTMPVGCSFAMSGGKTPEEGQSEEP